MKKLAHLLVVALTAVAGVGLVTSSAAAVTFDHVAGSGGNIRWNDCESFDYAWAATDDSGLATEWEATATLYTAGGDFSDADHSSGSGRFADQDESFTVCWEEGAGTYEIEVEITYFDDSFQTVDSGIASGTMSISRSPRPARTATRSTLRISDRTPHFNERVTFTIRSKIRRAGAWRRHAHAPAMLIGRCVSRGDDSGWVLLAEGELGRRGVGYVGFRYDIPRSWRCRYKSATYRTDTAKASTSRAVRVRTGRGPRARVVVDGGSSGSVPVTNRGRVIASRGALSDLLG